MFGIAIISKKKLEELKQSAYYSGFQAARSVGYSDPTPPSYGRVEYRGPYAASLRSVTSDNTQTANTAVQEMQAEARQGVVKKRKMRPYKKSSYSDKNVILIREGSIVEELVFEKMGKMTYQEIAILVNKSHGTHVRGAQGPIRITTAMIGAVASRSYVWNAHLQYFVKVPKKH